MRAFLLRLGLAILAVVALSHAGSIARVKARFDEERLGVLKGITEEGAARLADELSDLPALPPPEVVHELARRHGLDAWVERDDRPLPPPPHGPFLGGGPPIEARRPLPGGHLLVAHPLPPGPPPIGPLDVAVQLLVVLGVVSLAAWALVRPLARDLGRLETAVGRLGGEDLGTRVDVPASGPTRPLAEGFNRMAERVERLVGGQRQLVQAVSHEMRTPHARLRFRLDALAEAADPAERDRLRDDIERDLGQIDGLLDELLAYLKVDAEPLPVDARPWSVREALHDVVDRVVPLRPDVSLHVEAGDDVPLAASRRWFERAVENLVTNAQRHARSEVRVASRVDDGALVVEVDDDGPGVPEPDRARLLEPFATGDASRSRATGGVGLGLAIVARTVARSGGTLALVDAPLGGLRARTTWPTA